LIDKRRKEPAQSSAHNRAASSEISGNLLKNFLYH